MRGYLLKRETARCFKPQQGTLWTIPPLFEEELSRFIDQVLEEGHYRFKRNRVYLLKELLLLLLKACTQNIALKSETAIYGSQETGKPDTRQNLEYRLDHFPEEILQGHMLVKLGLSNLMIVSASYHANPLVNDTNFIIESACRNVVYSHRTNRRRKPCAHSAPRDLSTQRRITLFPERLLSPKG